jgi:hypothetical protein
MPNNFLLVIFRLNLIHGIFRWNLIRGIFRWNLIDVIFRWNLIHGIVRENFLADIEVDEMGHLHHPDDLVRLRHALIARTCGRAGADVMITILCEFLQF